MTSPFSDSLSGHYCFQYCAVTALVLSLAACSSSNDSVSADPDIQAPSDNPSSTTGIPGDSRTTSIGEVLVFGDDGLSLYTFANDAEGESSCNNGCATTWPPAISDTEQSIGEFDTIARLDGSLQWTFKGSPLYTFSGDDTEGQVNGEGSGDVWFVARPNPFDTEFSALGATLVGRGTMLSGGNDPTVRDDFDGRTLYTFSEDPQSGSVCDNECATSWPPLLADRSATPGRGFSIISRDDGTSQWAINSEALYFFSGDSEPGDVNGNGVNDQWFAVLTDTPTIDIDL